jgi:hypothetical protein
MSKEKPQVKAMTHLKPHQMKKRVSKEVISKLKKPISVRFSNQLFRKEKSCFIETTYYPHLKL